jgi:diaminopimelate epimerase
MSGTFAKYQGLGNDFVLIDNTQTNAPLYSPEQSVRICDRNFGIGGDGVIFALPGGQEDCDFTMRIYNSDGSEPQMCGNGIRCLAKFLAHLNKVGYDNTHPHNYRIWTNAGVIVTKMTPSGDVTVDMGQPTLIASKVPTTLPGDEKGIAILQKITALDTEYEATAVSMGNPHCVSVKISI